MKMPTRTLQSRRPPSVRYNHYPLFWGERVIEKIVEILTIARDPILRDHLMRACSLSNVTFNGYVIQLLLPCGLLDAYPANLGIPGRPTRHRMEYQVSQKGQKFLELYNELKKLMALKIEDEKMYRRGRDYPYYKNGVKMDLAMQGKELKQWFTEDELKDYPKPNAYTGSLP